MDPRYNWPPQAPPRGHANAQYPHGFPPQNAYVNGDAPYAAMPLAHPQANAHGYQMASSSQPRVVIPPRANQTQHLHQAHQPASQPRPSPSHPQIVIPPRQPAPAFVSQMSAPRIRQVQVPVQRSGALSDNRRAPPQHPQAPHAKPAQRSQPFQEHNARSFQENHVPYPPQRTSSTPMQNQGQHRAPLRPQASQGTPGQVRSHPQVVIKKPASSHLQTPTRPQNAPPKALPVDLMVLILSAADEYLAAARSLGSIAAMTLKPADLDQYYKLMSTALGCMETVLKKYNQPPRDEAILRLRYASLLVEETDNTQEIEETLAKGITLCNRSRLNDLKYAMLHLQARYQFKSNHRAALKLLDQPIYETETFQHIVWVYAFRLLKVSLALQVPGRPETASALQQLHAVAHHAERLGDRAVFVTSCALEALIHLRSSAPDRLEHAQRAIASARSLQLELSIKQLGSIAILIDCIDVACSLQHGQPDAEKLAALQSKADQESEPSNGLFSVLIEKSFGGNLTFSTGGVFRKAQDGRDELVLAWLPKNDVKTLAYFLSGLASLPHDKGSKYLQEGLRVTQASLQRFSSLPISIPAAIAQRNWIKILDWHIKFSLGLIACSHEDKVTAKHAVTMLQEQISAPPFKGLEVYARSLAYLSGVVDQTSGWVQKALDTYSLPEFDLPDAGSGVDFKTDLAILATMNRLLIIRDPSHPDYYLTQLLFAQLQPLCASHPNQYIECAFRVIEAITIPEESINRQKTLSHTSTTKAQRLGNMQFMSMSLNYMASKFFANQVGEQPIKSVRAARNISKQGRSVLWRAVSLGICIDTFVRNGLFQDAQDCQMAFDEIADRLPEALKGTDADAEGEVDMED